MREEKMKDEWEMDGGYPGVMCTSLARSQETYGSINPTQSTSRGEGEGEAEGNP
jgi:hypothetical protein